MPASLAGPLLILAAPLAFWRGLSAAYALPKLVVVAAGLGVSGAAALAKGARRGEPSLDPPLGAFCAVSLLSTLASADPWLSAVGRHNGHTDALYGLALAVGAWYAAAWTEPDRRRSLTRAAVWVSAAAGLHAALQQAGLDPWRIGPLPMGRSVGTVGSPVDLGGLLAVAFPAALLAARDPSSPRADRLPVLLVAAGLAACASRAAWLAAAAGAAVALGPGPGGGASGLRPRRAAAAAAVLLVAALAWYAGSRRSYALSDSGRLAVWRVAARAAAARPLLGYGPGTFEHAFRLHRTPEDVRAIGLSVHLQDHAHDLPLNALATTGLLGAAAGAWFLWAAGTALWRRRESPLGRAALGAAAAWTAMQLFDPVSAEVHCTAAVLAASALHDGTPEEPRRWPPAALLAAGAATLVLGLRLSAADRLAWRGGAEPDPAASVELLGRAADAMPCVDAYAIRLVNRLGDAINAAHDAPAKAEYLGRALRAGRALSSCRPREGMALYTEGSAHLMAAQLGLTEHLVLAADRMDAALAVDPYHRPLLESRLDVAVRMGDAAKASSVRAVLASLP